MKTCTTCLEVKTLDLFNKDCTKEDGLASLCKVCRVGKYKVWADANKDKVRLKTKRYANISKERSQKHRDELSDGYVKQFIGKDVSQDYLDLKREQLAVRRTIYQINRKVRDL